MSESANITAKELAEFCAQLLDDKKAENVSLIEISNVSLIADFFIICTGTSHPHLNALAEWLKRKNREKYNIRPIAVDGSPSSEWIVVDFGNVIVHILTQDARERYQLEELWSDAEKMEKFLSEKLNEI